MRFVAICVIFLLCTTCIASFRMNTICSLKIHQKASLQMAFGWDIVKKSGEEKMTRSFDKLQGAFGCISVGAPNPSILNKVVVENETNKQKTRLPEMSRVSVVGQTLIVEPFDKNMVGTIEKAILVSKLGINPIVESDGTIRLSIPPATEERRQALVKEARVATEDIKVAIRNLRRDMIDQIKKAEKDKEIGKDLSKRYQDDAQKISEEFVKKVDKMFQTKEKSLMTI